MTTLSTVPLYVVPNRQFQATLGLTETGSNYVRLWCTAAPPKSVLRAKLDGGDEKKPRERVELVTTDGGTAHPWNVGSDLFDVGGKYTLVAQEYTRGASAYGGGYQDDPDGAPSETKVGSETTISLFIGQRLTSTISAGGDSLTLALWVWDAVIRATTTATHGEASPALTSQALTARELSAVESVAVQSALDAIVDQVAATSFGTLSTVLGNSAGGFTKEWNDHVALAASHSAADANNVLPAGLASAASAKNLKDTVNEMLRYVRQHYLNDAVNGGLVAGRDSGGYHNSGGKKNDNINMPLFQSASSEADAYWAAADLWRSFEAHRVSTTMHAVPDTTNVLTILPLIMRVGLQVFTVWASISPTVPSTQSSGAMALIAPGVFTETPLQD